MTGLIFITLFVEIFVIVLGPPSTQSIDTEIWSAYSLPLFYPTCVFFQALGLVISCLVLLLMNPKIGGRS